MTFAGKGVAVTGAASGIGRATAISFGRQGARVALYDLNAAGLADTARRLADAGGEAHQVALDISDATQVRDAIDDLVRTWGGLDVLVNAAGISKSGTSSSGAVMQIREEDWDRLLDVNLMGTVFCAQAAARHMIRQRRGAIVNIASVAGVVPRLNAAAYGVSKAGVRMFTKCLALEVARYGVRVNAIAPGPIDTPMLGVAAGGADDPQVRERFIAGMPEQFRLGIPLGRLGQPEEVASAITYLASDEARHLTGVILNVDGMAQLS